MVHYCRLPLLKVLLCAHQLAAGGRLILPVGPENGDQEMLVVDKAEDGTVSARYARAASPGERDR